ncbi:glycosyltransferase [Bacteroidota bacterium]
MDYFPRVLVIGQPFHRNSGPGITISNLFENWPREKLALVADTKNIQRNDFSICPKAYRLGNKEFKILFPFNFLFRTGKSGQLIQQDKQKAAIKINKKNKFYLLFEWLFFSLGFNMFAFRIKLSKNLLNFIRDFNPEIIYSQLGKLELIYIVNEIKKEFKIPLAIHFMDDWPLSLGRGPLKKYWKKKIDKNLRHLLRNTDISFAISEGMKDAYTFRYQKEFSCFHNPIDPTKWKIQLNVSTNVNKEYSILYTGRIRRNHSKSIFDLIKVIGRLKKRGILINFDIYTNDWNSRLTIKLSQNKNVNIYSSISHLNIPDLLIKYDLLFLPLEFSSWSQQFVKYSMPTKAPEYMISGVPIFIYAPEQTELVRHARLNNWAFINSDNNLTELENKLLESLKDKKIRIQISSNAIKYATNNYSSEKVLNNFRNSFIELL